MSGILMMVIAIVVLGGAYLLYGRYLQNKRGIDPKAKTPAYELEDGVDYVPADTNVVFGHQFASIAGAGPINGPIQAAIFGWLPVLLWIPMVFMMAVTFTALGMTITKLSGALFTTGLDMGNTLQLIFAILLLILGVLVAIQGVKKLFEKTESLTNKILVSSTWRSKYVYIVNDFSLKVNVLLEKNMPHIPQGDIWGIFMLKSKNSEMFQKNFDAQKNQDQTTDKFCFAFIFASEEVANDNSDDREYKGCDTNNTNCFNDRSIKKSKRDADCERVDACCNSKNKHVFVINWSICDFDDFFFIPFTDGFNYHFAADETKKDKCDPVVNAGDVLLELAAKKPADERHKCLKSYQNTIR